ncbi:MAG: DNA replication/repair protein RecF [Anaerolineae bacterium]
MRLTHLGLTNFRTYRRLDLTLTPGVTLLVGDNAQGKTALLEAIYYLATSRSPRTSTDRELVNWGAADEPLPFARVAGEIQRHDRGVHVEIVVVEPPGSGRPLEKRVKIDGVARRALDLLGQVNVVFFSPDDIELVSDGPAVRRHYLDATLCQIDPRYCHALGQYRRVLAQRNHLLHVIQEGRGRRDELGFWDDLLIEHGSVITARRYALLRRLETWGTLIYGDLTGGQDALRVNYRPSALVSQSDRPTERGAVEAAQALLGQESLTAADVAAVFRERLAARAAAEIARGATLVGPHRDDFQLLGGEIDLHIYGSRGQQRTAALALKLGEIEAMHEATQERPVLLLDDVMSELDAPRRAYVAGRVAQYEQTLATATDWSDFSPPLQAQATCLVVRGGTVSPRRSDG